MDIKLGDSIEVCCFLDKNNEITINQHVGVSSYGSRYVKVIGAKQDYGLFANLSDHFLLGWSDRGINSFLIGSLDDFQLTQNVSDFDNYPYRWWLHSGVSVVRVVSEKKQIISSGEACIECKEYYPMAVPNRSNGTLLCYSCRELYNWKYSP